jgi:hypothetical protein
MSQSPPPPPEASPSSNDRPVAPKPNIAKNVIMVVVIVICLGIAVYNIKKKVNTPSDEGRPTNVPRQTQ